MKKSSLSIVALVAMMLMSFSLAFGQASTVSGTVSDPNGAVVSGASITLKNLATGQELKTVTSSNGFYTIPSVGAGLYSVIVEAAGFKKVVLQDVKVDVATPATVNAMLEVGAATESVVVQGAGEVLQTQSANVSTTISGKQITDLPFTSRDALDLVLNLPGNDHTGTPAHLYRQWIAQERDQHHD